MAKPRLLKILMAPLFGLPAPVANLALGVAIYFRWQDFYQIMRFSVLTVAGRDTGATLFGPADMCAPPTCKRRAVGLLAFAKTH